MIGGVQAVSDHFDHPLDAAEFKRPPHRAGVELYRAHIVRHAFEPHTHEEAHTDPRWAALEALRSEDA